MNLLVHNNELVGLSNGYKLLLLARTVYCDTSGYFIAVAAKDHPTKTAGGTNSLHRIIPGVIVGIFDANGKRVLLSPPYSAKEYLEKDALSVIEFEPRGRSLRWTASRWDPDRGARVEHKWCEFFGRRIYPEDILVAL